MTFSIFHEFTPKSFLYPCAKATDVRPLAAGFTSGIATIIFSTLKKFGLIEAINEDKILFILTPHWQEQHKSFLINEEIKLCFTDLLSLLSPPLPSLAESIEML